MTAGGLLNIHKPPGMTSFAVVAQIRRLTRQKRVGHGGTLDPDASGVLPVGIGQATRVFEYFEGGTKTYRAEIVLGVSTDTYDASGAVTSERDASRISQEQVEGLLPQFTGDILQRPPMYSALKRDGERLYTLARRGETVELDPRPVRILRLEMREWRPPAFTVEVECGRGTYIRSLAYDIGEALGVGAHMGSLVRTEDGPFLLEEAITLEEFAAAVSEGRWEELLLPLDFTLSKWRAFPLTAEQARMVQNGRALTLETESANRPTDLEPARAYGPSGAFIGVLRYRVAEAVWRPVKVFGGEPQDPT